MIQLSKKADYGMVIMTYLAKDASDQALSANKIAASTGIPSSMTAKILKLLSHHQLVNSTQGNKGGYALQKKPQDISLIEILEALDEPITLTECSSSTPLSCTIHDHCSIQPHWNLISQSLRDMLSGLKLSDLLNTSSNFAQNKLLVQNQHNVTKLPMNNAIK